MHLSFAKVASIPTRKLDIERLHVGVQAGILHGQHDGVLVAFVVVGAPPAWGRHEGSAGHPVGADGVDDVAIDETWLKTPEGPLSEHVDAAAFLFSKLRGVRRRH